MKKIILIGLMMFSLNACSQSYDVEKEVKEYCYSNYEHGKWSRFDKTIIIPNIDQYNRPAAMKDVNEYYSIKHSFLFDNCLDMANDLKMIQTIIGKPKKKDRNKLITMVDRVLQDKWMNEVSEHWAVDADWHVLSVQQLEQVTFH